MTDPSDKTARAHEPPSTIGSSLLHRVKALDPEAWNEMVTRYYPLVYGWCRKIGMAEHDAADVCQDTFCSVATSIANFQRTNPGDTFGGWLRRIVQRRISDHRKKAREAGTAAGGTDAMALLDDVIADLSTTTSSNGTGVNTNLRRVLEYVKQEFEEVSWKAFMMTAVEELSPSEVATHLGITRNAVYLAKSRILRRIREMLDSQRG